MRCGALLFIIFILIPMESMVLFDFNTTSDLSKWRVVNDVVMGGRSNGN